MAIAIIFGLLFATLLTLGLVPVLYALFFRVNFKGFSY
jgi:multidrug efflux pump subunit AcrB